MAGVLGAVALIVAACGGDAGHAGRSPTDTVVPVATTSVESRTEPADTPGRARQDGAEPDDPRGSFFVFDRVLEIRIEIASDDWDTLRHQTRTFEDLMAEIEEYALSRPFINIYTWFPATVTVDGEIHTDVGVRKKGFLGSQSDTKPSLKLRFDKYVDGQSLGGVMERMTLNNSVQDPSMVNTCLSYRVFAAAGSPAPRCNFATVSVNGRDLGLYVHVEEIKTPFLARHFDSAEGALYEGTVSDFTPEYRGTMEKKANEDAADWSDIDAVVAALEDRSDAGLKALGEIVDLDRFLTFWATEVLIGHWDGYSGNRNNYWLYREPDGRFVFLPWGVDDTFHLKEDPNPFDDISDPPPSVLALTSIPNRLYNHPDWRAMYVERLKEILDTVWDEEELLAAVEDMAAIVQQHSLPAVRQSAADDTDRVRKYILKRRGEIHADLTPEPPDWPEPETSERPAAGSGTLGMDLETTWGSNLSYNPLGEGEISNLTLDGFPETTENTAVLAGHSNPDEVRLLPDADEPASIVVLSFEDDGSLSGMTLVLERDLLVSGATLVIGADAIAGGVWFVQAGAATPDSFTPFTEGALKLTEAGTDRGDAIVGSFTGRFGWVSAPNGGASAGGDAADLGLVINEVAAKGDPLDWFELHNTSPEEIPLDGFQVADSLTDPDKRVTFPPGTTIPPGAYMRFATDKDGWPGFALGSDEELGLWLNDGTPVDRVDWKDGDSGENQSYARLPDATGHFQTVDNPTPGSANQR